MLRPTRPGFGLGKDPSSHLAELQVARHEGPAEYRMVEERLDRNILHRDLPGPADCHQNRLQQEGSRGESFHCTTRNDGLPSSWGRSVWSAQSITNHQWTAPPESRWKYQPPQSTGGSKSRRQFRGQPEFTGHVRGQPKSKRHFKGQPESTWHLLLTATTSWPPLLSPP